MATFLSVPYARMSPFQSAAPGCLLAPAEIYFAINGKSRYNNRELSVASKVLGWMLHVALSWE